MDAVEFLNEGTRMCHSYESCVGCPMEDWDDYCMVSVNLKQMISIVEQWAKEHPVKTRQSEFLKIFPSAQIEDETVSICPAKLNVVPHATNIGKTCIYVHDCTERRKCKRDFWLKEIK